MEIIHHKILIVEDESIVALDIKNFLEEKGFKVVGTAVKTDEALRLTREKNPDLVIMDVMLKGKEDGIEAGKIIHQEYDVPIIYLTALSDRETLERAKTTDPFGYIIKPFEDQQLYSTIKMAIYRDKMAKRLRQNEEWFSTTLKSIGDGVIATDENGRIKFMNPVAEKITGWKAEEVIGKELDEVIMLISEENGQRMKTPVDRVLKKGKVVGLANHTLLKSKSGKMVPIDDSAAPIKDKYGNLYGVVMVFKDITARRKMERERRILEKDLIENKNKIKELHQVAIKLGRCQDENEVYQITIDAAVKILDFDVCSLDIVEDDMFVVKATSSDVDSDGSVSMPVTEGLAGKCYRQQRTILINDITKDNDAKPAKNTYRAAISVPIERLGVFQVISTEVGAFNNDDVELAELLISHTSAAIKRIRSEKEIRYLGFHDSLTGLYNRAYFDEELRRLDTPRQLPLSFIMGDVNGLKLVNDAFGHKQGDDLLKLLAGILKESCRKEDIIARWGGDEFMILLPQTSETDAQKVIERINKKCEVSNHHPIKPSIALGTATKVDEQQKVGHLLRKAEDRMYRQKIKESKNATNSIINSLEKSLWDKDIETEEHGQRMKKLARKLGKKINLPKNKLEELSLLAVLHDIGKLAIADEILNKPAPLNNEEWVMVQKHPEIGYRIAKSSPEIAPIAEEILAHHEWWNGEGYPQGLRGDEIPLLARIIAIVDAFDVMTHERPYQSAVSKKEACAELEKYAGTQFDPELVKIFVKEII